MAKDGSGLTNPFVDFMRLVFVNHAHPDIAHVSGTRFGQFGKELARRGHQVVLLTSTLPGTRGNIQSGGDLAAQLAEHNWREPFLLPAPPLRKAALELIRTQQVPPLVRRGLTLWQLVVNGGMFSDWGDSADVAARRVARHFKPEAVWATFGNTTNLDLARRLARYARCPWIMDLKDNWEVFVPSGLRMFMAWRLRGAVAWTSNSYYHQQIGRRWFHGLPTDVIYSGVADAFFEPNPSDAIGVPSQILLSGSTYSEAHLENFFRVVRDWVAQMAPAEREGATFTYVGSDCGRVDALLKTIGMSCPTHVLPQQTVEEFAGLAKRSFVNAYITAEKTFHHKLMELLVCGRPVVCFPGERTESISLARQTKTMFHSCSTGDELSRALSAAWATRVYPVTRGSGPAWRWEDFAAQLESIIARRS